MDTLEAKEATLASRLMYELHIKGEKEKRATLQIFSFLSLLPLSNGFFTGDDNGDLSCHQAIASLLLCRRVYNALYRLKRGLHSLKLVERLPDQTWPSLCLCSMELP